MLELELRVFGGACGIAVVAALVAALATGEPRYAGLAVAAAVAGGLAAWVSGGSGRASRTGAGGLGLLMAGAIVAFTPLLGWSLGPGVAMMMVGAVVFLAGLDRVTRPAG
ncbi:hypothetical protein [Rhodococcus rhodnii]|uniref:Uncharacterized protein n=1 Tax=Rhodococcus rhodnii LMG 5362 TaxID=1273125 RepID=R7WSG4_9NOCA|nr:hypothetical protein [Rhodococcus rhodnii]EOM78282.1 hypothetical protein Rrhod_0367 [Rhodococcus rhodnii LMG 5362]